MGRISAIMLLHREFASLEAYLRLTFLQESGFCGYGSWQELGREILQSCFGRVQTSRPQCHWACFSVGAQVWKVYWGESYWEAIRRGIKQGLRHSCKSSHN
jgi:hypothetical protein